MSGPAVILSNVLPHLLDHGLDSRVPCAIVALAAVGAQVEQLFRIAFLPPHVDPILLGQRQPGSPAIQQLSGFRLHGIDRDNLGESRAPARGLDRGLRGLVGPERCQRLAGKRGISLEAQQVDDRRRQVAQTNGFGDDRPRGSRACPTAGQSPAGRGAAADRGLSRARRSRGCSPKLSPWSDVRISQVRSRTPRRPSSPSSRPNCSSRRGDAFVVRVANECDFLAR